MSVVVTDRHGIVVWLNTSAARLFARPQQQLVQTSHAELEKSRFNALPDQPGMYFVAGAKPEEAAAWLRRHDLDLGADGFRAVCYVDVTEETQWRRRSEQLQQQLDHLSTIDPVSGLLNRRAMVQQLEPLVSRSRRYQNPLSVIAMELLNMDAVKQQFGEDALQHGIKELSFLLKDQLRWADLVSRTDDNQFVFVLPETDKSAAVHLANKINHYVADLSINYQKHSIRWLASFGVSAWEKGNDSVLLLRHATQSLELAKQNGPGSVQES
jgi:diguanylate cyclase (GGDEF)-like protein